jgi:hypothetical protein
MASFRDPLSSLMEGFNVVEHALDYDTFKSLERDRKIVVASHESASSHNHARHNITISFVLSTMVFHHARRDALQV